MDKYGASYMIVQTAIHTYMFSVRKQGEVLHKPEQLATVFPVVHS